MKEITDDIVNLILTMIDTYSQYGDILKFTKPDIDKIIKEYGFFKKLDCNELGWIILWENGYITDEVFSKEMCVEIEDKKFYTTVDDFDDVLNNSKYETEIKVLSSNDDSWWEQYSTYDNNIKAYFWNDYTEETLKEIMKFCFKKGIEVEVDDEYELMDENNTFLKNGELYFKDQELVDLIDDDEFDELKRSLNIAICEAQESADRDEVYTRVNDAFVEEIGPYERKTITKIDKETNKEKRVEKIRIRLDFNMKDVKHYLRETYNNYEYVEGTFGDLVYVLKEMDFFDFRTPDYNYINGSIDESYLNEITRDRLSWD